MHLELPFCILGDCGRHGNILIRRRRIALLSSGIPGDRANACFSLAAIPSSARRLNPAYQGSGMARYFSSGFWLAFAIGRRSTFMNIETI